MIDEPKLTRRDIILALLPTAFRSIGLSAVAVAEYVCETADAIMAEERRRERAEEEGVSL